MSTEKSLVTVYKASSQPEAHIIKSRLEAEGIPVLLSYESLGLVYGIITDGLGEIKVMVPGHLAEEAKQILSTDWSKLSDQGPDKEPGNQSTLPESD